MRGTAARDQRGTPRPLFGQHDWRCNLGAFELVARVFVRTVGR